jgi:hypothetical protein
VRRSPRAEHRDEILDQLIVERLLGRKDPVPDRPEDDVGDGAGIGSVGKIATLPRTIGDDREGLAAVGSFLHLTLAFSPGSVGMGPIRATSPDDFSRHGAVAPSAGGRRLLVVTCLVSEFSCNGAGAPVAAISPGTVAR